MIGNFYRPGKLYTIEPVRVSDHDFDPWRTVKLCLMYTNVVPNRLIEYILEDGRTVSINFKPVNSSIKIVETFDAEDANSAELQRQAWQSILNRFALSIESRI